MAWNLNGLSCRTQKVPSYFPVQVAVLHVDAMIQQSRKQRAIVAAHASLPGKLFCNRFKFFEPISSTRYCRCVDFGVIRVYASHFHYPVWIVRKQTGRGTRRHVLAHFCVVESLLIYRDWLQVCKAIESVAWSTDPFQRKATLQYPPSV